MKVDFIYHFVQGLLMLFIFKTPRSLLCVLTRQPRASLSAMLSKEFLRAVRGGLGWLHC